MSSKCLVLMATYNGEKYIKDQITSILNQRGVRIALCISDDGSTDNTTNIIRSYDDKRIFILPSNNRFGSASRNFFRLLRDAIFDEYDYIALSDQDDIWDPEKIINAISAIKNKNLDGYASNVIAFWEDGSTKLIDKSSPQVEWDYLFGSAGPGCTIVLKSEIAKRIQQELREKVALSQEIELHDWLIYAYVRSKNLKWCVDPWPSMKYRQHSNNEFGANSGIKTFIKRWKYAHSGWYRKQIIAISNFCDLNETVPIMLIQKNSYADRLKLALMAHKLRKKNSEAMFLRFLFLFPCFK